MKRLTLFAAAALAGCSAQTDNQPAGSAVGNAADNAVDIPAPVPDNRATPTPPAARPTEKDVGSEAPFTADSAQGAANVVQTYFALLEAKKYSDAHKLWGPSSDLADGTFAAKFAANREYHAEVYAPGDIEGAAGSLYVEVPVKVYGVTAKGEKLEEPQVVTLRRVNNVDGSTAEQRRWHIAKVDTPPDPH